MANSPAQARLALSWILLFVLTLLSLGYVPVESDFVLSPHLTCEVWPGWWDFWGAFIDETHIPAYALVFLVAAVTFRENNILKATAFTFVLSSVGEIEQLFFLRHDCELRDLVSNAVGIALGASIYFFFRLVALRFRRFRS